VKISIVIPSYNGRPLLEKNLPAVLRACQNWQKCSPSANRQSWEIIVVDDASTDDSLFFLKKNYPQIKVVKHRKNRRFAAACNSGVNAAKGEVVILLNNDVYPEIGFLKPLVKHFTNEKVFAVGCLQIEKRKNQHFRFGRGKMAFRRGFVVHWRAKNQNLKITDWAFAGAAAYSREKWQYLQGMDTLFRPAYEEDRDLSYRALKHGFKILFEPKSRVYHKPEVTNLRVFGSGKMKIFSFKNQFLFVWKNITDWEYFLKHFLWLPYHLFFTNIRSKGYLGLGFLLALFSLPEVLKSRRKVKKLFTKKDKELI